jgi:hypothetical protein
VYQLPPVATASLLFSSHGLAVVIAAILKLQIAASTNTVANTDWGRLGESGGRLGGRNSWSGTEIAW